MNITGEVKILKDDRGVYKTTLVGKEVNPETNEEEKIFMQVNVGFRKGIEVKNKTKINIKDGFISLYRIATDEVKEDGTPKYKYFPKFMIMDFDIVEDGIDEVQPSKRASNNSNNQKHYDEDTFSSYYSSDDELPF